MAPPTKSTTATEDGTFSPVELFGVDTLRSRVSVSFNCDIVPPAFFSGSVPATSLTFDLLGAG